MSNNPVSYTHLDVYKRQPYFRRKEIKAMKKSSILILIIICLCSCGKSSKKVSITGEIKGCLLYTSIPSQRLLLYNPEADEENREKSEYILQHIDPESDYLKSLYRDTHVKLLRPRMASGHLQEMCIRDRSTSNPTCCMQSIISPSMFD